MTKAGYRVECWPYIRSSTESGEPVLYSELPQLKINSEYFAVLIKKSDNLVYLALIFQGVDKIGIGNELRTVIFHEIVRICNEFTKVFNQGKKQKGIKWKYFQELNNVDVNLGTLVNGIINSKQKSSPKNKSSKSSGEDDAGKQ